MNLFRGRSLEVVNSFSVAEQMYLYERTRELKLKTLRGEDVDYFRIQDNALSVYIMFLEDSTRTKESFINAARFHGARVNVFNPHTSSFNKKESITDTVKMLFGYADRSLFVVRSKEEGLCSWLDEALGDYARQIGYPKPSFINGGDGRHEHPTQEFLDEFSFLEQREWDNSHIHLALVGDLFHGRTVHSKADGLRVFKEVQVDLVAPKELQMPASYIDKMKRNGFLVREYASIDEYLASGATAPIWYFTRLQLERMGDEIREKAQSLRAAVSFTREFLPKIAEGTRFYHPLPRHREFPTIPSFLDATPLNGWDRQSINGYFTRIVEIGLLAGDLGKDFSGSSVQEETYADDFVEEVAAERAKPHNYKVGIKPVENGIVIDHIGKGRDLALIWDHIDKIRRIMNLNIRSSHGVYHSNEEGIYKGIISLPNVLSFDERQIKMLGAVAPECTLNIIHGSKITKKYRMHTPPRVYNFREISCKNENCISHPSHCEPVKAEFIRLNSNTYSCKYCEHPHSFHEIWDV
ncbi:MAG: aspartate carbamoyltransferase [Spirochaetales bacterium]|nr:aspartate carbamoyltransferase [Spirochaetales bacterium]